MNKITIATKLSEPLPPLNWTHVGKLWQGRPWTRHSSLTAILGGGWFKENGKHTFADKDTAEFAYAACRVLDILRGSNNAKSA